MTEDRPVLSATELHHRNT